MKTFLGLVLATIVFGTVALIWSLGDSPASPTPTPTVTVTPTPVSPPFAELGAEDGTGTITEKDGKYELILPASPDKIEISTDASKVGARLYRWGDECYVDVSMPFTATTLTAVEGNKVKRANSKVELNLYGTEAHGSDVFEFEIILKEKPKTNKIIYDIDLHGLVAYYQPPLTDEYVSGWSEEYQDNITVTETEVRNSRGDVVVHRPEHVVGSYAIYHTTKSGHILGQTNYMAGKAFHIYRPQPIDANGMTCWADVRIEGNKEIITIPWDFLNSAKYPIRHAAGDTFGREDTAESNESLINYIRGLVATGAVGVGVSMTAYTFQWGAYDMKTALYKSDDYLETNGTTTERSVDTGAVAAWETWTFPGSPCLSAVEYWLAVWSEGGGNNCSMIYYDHGDAGDGRQDSETYNGWPDPSSPSDNDHKRCVYVTYTPGCPATGGQIF